MSARERSLKLEAHPVTRTLMWTQIWSYYGAGVIPNHAVRFSENKRGMKSCGENWNTIIFLLTNKTL